MGRKEYRDARKPQGENIMGDAVPLGLVQPGISLGALSSSSRVPALWVEPIPPLWLRECAHPRRLAS